ncbi:MAG: cysteine desulfurase family protein [bacterium]
MTAAPPPGFLDAASGQPLNPAAREALQAAADAGWADPRRLYREARQAALLLDAAREAIAGAAGTRPADLAFTGAAPVALRQAVEGALAARPGPLVVSAVEHSAVLEAADEHAAQGGEVRIVGVDRLGRVDLESWGRALPGAALACLQSANHEVGTLQPVAAAEAAREAGVPVLVDATMTLGRTDPPPAWDLLVGQASTWGGPTGLGVLAVRPATRWRGAGTDGRRVADPAPVSIPLAVAAARGLEWADGARRTDASRARQLTDRLRGAVAEGIADVVLLGDPVERLPYLTAFSCLYVDGETLVLGLDRAGYAISSGSSCVADTRRPSHVLAAMGALTQGNVRVSLPFGVTDATIDGFLATLPGVVEQARAWVGAPDDRPEEGRP